MMKIFVARGKTVAAVAAVLVLAIFFVALNFGNLLDVAASASSRSLPIYRVRTDEKKVAISFDAAWGNEDTQQLIDILNQYNVKATFFVVGSWVDKYPESVKALHDAGHDVMNHSNSHPHMSQLSAAQMVAEANACSDKIEKVTGTRPNLFRMPYGDYNTTVVDTLKQAGYYSIQWDVDSLDWKGLSAAEIAERVLSKTKSGSIVLFHNAAQNTPEALPKIIETLQGQGYEFVKIAELICKENYAIDNTGEQYPLK